MTYVVRGLKRTPSGAQAKAEIITSSKEEADALSVSMKKLGFTVIFQYFSDKDPDQVRHLALIREVNALGSDFFKGTILDVKV